MCYNKHTSTCFFVRMYQYLYRMNAHIHFCWIKILPICNATRRSPTALHEKLLNLYSQPSVRGQFFLHAPCPTGTEVSSFQFLPDTWNLFKLVMGISLFENCLIKPSAHFSYWCVGTLHFCWILIPCLLYKLYFPAFHFLQLI